MCNPWHKLYGLDNKGFIIVHFSELIEIFIIRIAFFFSYDRLRKDQDNIINIEDAKILIELNKGIQEMGIIIDIDIKRW